MQKIIRGILLLENKIKKASIKTMFYTIKESKRTFFGVLIALLIPIMFISGYTFYSDYSTFKVDYSAFDGIELTPETLISGEALNSFLLATENSISSFSPSEATSTLALKAINFALKLLIIAFAAVFAISAQRKQKADATEIVLESAKRILGMALISVFFIWIYQLAYRMFFSSILTMLAMQRIANGLLAAVPTVVTTVAIITFLASLVLSHLYFTVITVCKKRTRALLALSYSRAIMKGKKQIFKLLLWVFVAFSIPVFISAFAPFLTNLNLYVAIGTFVLGEVLFVVLTMLAIIYLTPRHTIFEIESDIVNKIRQAQMQAYQAAAKKFEKDNSDKEKDDNNQDNNEENNQENPVENKEQ